ncbi:MAG TPA: hypothetical protein VMS89_08550 [Methanoregulaceae archaeon]|nr:hypothetical protein [Methanoregulaceae archaeon]
MKSMTFIILIVMMAALIALPISAVDTSGGFQKGSGSSNVASLINTAYANYQANPVQTDASYLLPEIGESPRNTFLDVVTNPPLASNMPNPFPAFDELYQTPDVFAPFNYQIPIPMTFLGSTDNVPGWIHIT